VVHLLHRLYGVDAPGDIVHKLRSYLKLSHAETSGFVFVVHSNDP